MTLEQQLEREFQDAKAHIQTAKQKANTSRSVGDIMRVLMGQAASAARGECGAGGLRARARQGLNGLGMAFLAAIDTGAAFMVQYVSSGSHAMPPEATTGKDVQDGYTQGQGGT